MACASGEENEVRAVFRRIVDEYLVLVDPDRVAVRALGIEQLPLAADTYDAAIVQPTVTELPVVARM